MDDDTIPATLRVDPASLVAARDGSVLLRNTILKSDHFPGCQNKTLTPLLEGCPNFRKVDELPVFGVAIPTTAGLRVALDQIYASAPYAKLYWCNMREEPLVYINGRPFVIRDKDNPFGNLEYTGIHTQRVEEMEERLKVDILEEAAQYEGQVLVTDENDDFTVFDMLVQVSPRDVLTPRDVFQELQDDGYNIVYERIPITDEKAPKDTDFDRLVTMVWQSPESSAFVFNCQMGRGRTTTGMIITSLLLLKRKGALQTVLEQMQSSSNLPALEALNAPEWLASGVKRSLESQAKALENRSEDAHAILKAGHFLVVRSLLRILPNAAHSKALLDSVIDACSAMQNLRSAIAKYRDTILQEPREAKRQKILSVCMEYIDRYCALIVFASYLNSKFAPGEPSHQPIKRFKTDFPEIQSVLERLLRGFPLMSLELDLTSGKDKLTGAPEDGSMEHLYRVLSQRKGVILSPSAILKADVYPSLRNSRLPQPLAKAPNFRQADGNAPVFGVGICSLPGIKAVLSAVHAAPDTSDAERRPAVWHNLREEPVLYINHKPYVLREVGGAYKNMKEYSGIKAEALEGLESRLKAEVLAEARRLGGKVHVLKEDMEESSPVSEKGRLYSVSEDVEDESAVMTPREVYEHLAQQGYRVTYKRIPITDGMCPNYEDVDEVHESLARAPADATYIFSCQQGKGRTTIGMVMAVLLLTGKSWFRSAPLARQFKAPLEVDLAALARRPSNAGAAAGATDGDSDNAATEMDGDSDVDDRSPRMPAVPPGALGSAANGASTSSHNNHAPGRPAIAVVAATTQRTDGLQQQYIGVRRLVGELASGELVRAWVDRALDACAHMVNLRTVIGRYRQTSAPQQSHQPEMDKLRRAFSRDVVALARYCLLIAYGAYISRNVGDRTFSSWITAMNSVQIALRAPLEEPVHSLTPIMSIAPRMRSSEVDPETHEDEHGRVDSHHVEEVMRTRRFRMLTPHSILKAFRQHGARVTDQTQGKFGPAVAYEPDVRRLPDLPIWMTSNPTVPGMRSLVKSIGEEGRYTVVIIDTREELTTYVNGVPYARRELELPSASVHHAGINWKELAKLEGWLKEDVKLSSSQWMLGDSYRILVHHEVQEEQVDADTSPQAMTRDWSLSSVPTIKLTEHDPTQPEQRKLTMEAYWREVNGFDLDSVDRGVATPFGVALHLRKEGLNVRYRRVPLSRNRTPAAKDLDDLHTGAYAAGGSDLQNTRFLLISRATSTSTSTSFVSHLLVAMLEAEKDRPEAQPKELVIPRLPSNGMDSIVWSEDGSQSKRRRVDDSRAGIESSVVVNLCRVLEQGPYWRARVHHAISQFSNIVAIHSGADDEHVSGPSAALTDSIRACSEKVRDLKDKDDPHSVLERSNARRFGTHYLMRYFLLVCFRAYFDEWLREAAVRAANGDIVSGFKEWFEARKELSHLLLRCKM